MSEHPVRNLKVKQLTNDKAYIAGSSGALVTWVLDGGLNQLTTNAPAGEIWQQILQAVIAGVVIGILTYFKSNKAEVVEKVPSPGLGE